MSPAGKQHVGVVEGHHQIPPEEPMLPVQQNYLLQATLLQTSPKRHYPVASEALAYK